MRDSGRLVRSTPVSWDRRCIECGGWLTDRRGSMRQCVQCHTSYQYAGGMLTPLRTAAAEPEPAPARRRSTGSASPAMFGETPSGTYDDRRRQGLYVNEVVYDDLFQLGPIETCRSKVAGLVESGQVREAAEAALEAVGDQLELELFFPGQEADATPYIEILDEVLARANRADAEELRRILELRQVRFQRARERTGVDPARLAPFRASVGRDIGRFLGDRRRGFGDLPEERHLPLEGGTYRLLEPESIRVGAPGGPSREVALDAFHLRTQAVSNGEYAAFLDRTGYPPHPLWGWRGLDLPNRPVVGLRWEDAASYAAHYGGRLPTEAEWMAALREGLVPARDLTWELCFDDAGDPGGPMGTQGAILLGEAMPKALRGVGGRRSQLAWDSWRADAGFRLVLDPRMA